MIEREIEKAREGIKAVYDMWAEIDASLRRMTDEIKVWPKMGKPQ